VASQASGDLVAIITQEQAASRWQHEEEAAAPLADWERELLDQQA
jgi:hypothetical protein